MKKLLTLILSALIVGVVSFPHSADAAVRVRAHTTRSGSYVPAHYRSNPDHSRLNNWSTKGNYNPYTGKTGTRNYYW